MAIKTVSSVVVITTSAEKLSVFTGATIMAPKIQVFLQVALLCYVVTNSIAGVIDYEKAFARLEKEMKDLKEHSAGLEKEMKDLKEHSAGLEKEMKDLKEHSAGLEKEMKDLKEHSAGLEKEMKDLKEHSAGLEKEMKDLKENSDEEIYSLHKKNEELEKRLERIEAKG